MCQRLDERLVQLAQLGWLASARRPVSGAYCIALAAQRPVRRGVGPSPRV